MGKVFFPINSWAERVISQCVGFPTVKHDDAVDASALIGLALDETVSASRIRKVQEQKMDCWDRAWAKQDAARQEIPSWRVA